MHLAIISTIKQNGNADTVMNCQ